MIFRNLTGLAVAAVFLALCLVMGPRRAWGEFVPNEPDLYPAGAPSADTLKSEQFLLGPPWGGWVAGGAGDHVTLGWDYPAALFAGLPAFLVRASPSNQGSPFRVALESYGANWGGSYTDKRNSNFQLEHQGISYWAHILMSWRLTSFFRVHLYGGYNYANYEKYSPYEGATFPISVFQNAYSPDYGATLEWDTCPWLKMYLNGIYGNSFYFSDQISRKSMAIFSLNFAPFSLKSVGILRTFRFQLSALWLSMPIAGNYSSSLALPLYPTLYWQFPL